MSTGEITANDLFGKSEKTVADTIPVTTESKEGKLAKVKPRISISDSICISCEG